MWIEILIKRVNSDTNFAISLKTVTKVLKSNSENTSPNFEITRPQKPNHSNDPKPNKNDCNPKFANK